MGFRMSHATQILLLAVLLLVSSCGKKGGEKAPGSGAGEVVMTIGKADVTTADVESEFARLTRHMAGRFAPEQMEQMRPELVQQAKENLIHKILLGAAVAKEDVRIGDAELEAKIAEYRRNFPDEETYRRNLEEMGLTEEGFRAEVREEIGIETLLNDKTKDVPPANEAAIAKYYEENRERFKQEEELRASHILIIFQEADDEAAKKSKRAKAEAIHDTLLAGGDFTELARRHSGCPSSQNGGDLGYFARDRMVKPFEDAAFALAPGKMSGVVETQFGYHIIKVTDRRDARIVPLEEVSAAIGEELGREARREVIQNYLRSLRDQADIRIFPEAKTG